MDGNHFDDLTKAFISRRSRRSIIKGIAGTLAGLAVGLTGRKASSPLGGNDAAAQVPCAITCPANITVGNDPNQCGAVVNYPAPTTTGDCGTVTCSPASGSFFPVGTTTVTCTTTGAPAPSCTFTVTVIDVQPPSITCPANGTVPNDPNQCGAVVTFLPPLASDNCPGVVTNCSPASGSFFPVGTTTSTCTATDASGNTATCSFTLTVEDDQSPIIACPPNQTVDNDPGLCSAVVDYPAPVASDNCPGVVQACDPPTASVFDVGDTTVTCTATDASANTANCTFIVTVNDAEDPIITCPPDISVDAAPGETSAIVDFADPAASDNCPGVGLACDPATGSAFPIGASAVTCTATDVSGNDVACTFTVTVNAVAAPTATAEASQVPAGGVTTLPSTGTAPSDSSSDLAKWGPLAAIGGAAAVLASRLRKSFNPVDEES
jgi:hypothetical protein